LLSDFAAVSRSPHILRAFLNTKRLPSRNPSAKPQAKAADHSPLTTHHSPLTTHQTKTIASPCNVRHNPNGKQPWQAAISVSPPGTRL
jgi:hypothetical protein